MKSVLEKFWVDIKGFEGIYKVSRNGDVKSVDRVDTNGHRHKSKMKAVFQNSTTRYYFVSLKKNGISKQIYIHRLIAEAFIPNPENKPCIDHINAVRTDNRIENLRWVTYKENRNNPISKQNYTEARKGKPISDQHKQKLQIPIVQLTKDGEFIRHWGSATDILNELGYNNSYIGKCCKGEYKTAYGYKWQYLSDYEKTH